MPGSRPIWKPGTGSLLDRSAPSAQGLSAFWLFNESSGNIAYDLTGRYNFVMNSGMLRISDTVGPGVRPDAVTGQGIATGHPMAGSSQVSWIGQLRQKTTISNQFGPYLGSDMNFTSGIYIGENGITQVQFIVAGIAQNVTITPDTLVHVAATLDTVTGNLLVYVNGVRKGNFTTLQTSPLPAYTQTYIGKGSVAASSYFTNSSILSMKVYGNRILTPSEIEADYINPYAAVVPANQRRWFATGAPVATTYTFTGPTSLTAGASGTFTLTGNGTTTAQVSISDGGAGGTVTTSPVTLNGTSPVTFTYGNNTPQTVTLTPTNNGGLTDPSPRTVVINAVAATAYTFTGPTTLPAGATGTYTLTGNGATTAPITISDGGAGGTITTSPVSLNNTSPVTFTYSNNTPQTVTLTPSNGSGLANPSAVVVTITPIVPPATSTYGTFEAGTGSIIGIPAGGSVILMGPWQTPFRVSLKEVVSVQANGTFNLDYQFSTDNGTTWYTGRQVPSVVSAADGTATTNRAHMKIEPGWYWRIQITNTDAGSINAVYEKRFTERGQWGS